ncbi:MAG TPA: PIG-L deacetylase family protein [Acidimicrobiales bacterium]|jgi:LmbE family N-acetylglucosaminyl deacetylase|nr:PIG-L deacetylase family protein [Acidimicrobiales bacterium]
MATLYGDAPARALAVYAHPDDPEISCGATLARWAAAGTQVHVLVCNRGEKGSRDPASDPDELARRRVGEMEAAGRVLGLAGREQLAIPDGDLVNSPAVRAAVVAAIRRIRPSVVVCPDPTAVIFGDTYFNHADHRIAGWLALEAVAPAAGNPHYFPDAGPAHAVEVVLLSGTLEPNVWVDVADSLQTKVDALLCHASQLEGSAEFFRTVLQGRAEAEGRAAGVRYAEGFRRLRLGG